MRAPRHQALEDAAERHVSFHFTESTTEEQHILLLAEQLLTEDDGAEIDQAFGANCDSVAGQGHVHKADHRGVFTRIVDLVPGTIGLGAERRCHGSKAQGGGSAD